MGLKTTAFDRAEALGWSMPELARRAGLSVETLYKIRAGRRGPGQYAIEGLMRAFPNLGYRDLFFVPTNSTDVQQVDTSGQTEEIVAA